MRIVILTQYYPPEIGAPQNRLSHLARFASSRGHDITVLTAMPSYPIGRIYPGFGGWTRREVRDAVQVLRVASFPTQKTSMLSRLASYFSFVLSSAIVGTALLEKHDYLIIESPPLFLGLAGFWLSRLKGSRMIFNVSDLWPESAVRLGILRPRGVAYRLSTWLESFCYRRAWLVTGQSRSILQDITARFPQVRTFLMSNGVDASVYGPERQSDETRASLGGKDRFVVVYAGLHGLAQGLEQILEAAGRLVGDPRFKFVLVGDGPEKARLASQAREHSLSNLVFMDPRPVAEVPSLLASADAIVVPLKLYIPGAVPSKLYEAMASGRPVVLLAEGEAADVVRQHAAGLVVTPGDVAALVQALQQLREDPGLRTRMGRDGNNAARIHFDRGVLASRFLQYLADEETTAA